MVSKVKSNADAYIQQRFATLPEAQQGEAHVLKSGESLWKIAQTELGKGAKTSEINDYVLLLAKVNGLDTKEKMNNIKVNTTIYLPGKKTNPLSEEENQTIEKPKEESKWLKPFWSTAPDGKDDGAQNPFFQWQSGFTWNSQWTSDPAVKPSPVPAPVSKPEPVTVKPKPAPVQQTPPKPVKQLNPEEQIFADKVNTVMTDKTVRIQESDLRFINSKDRLYHVVNYYEGKSGYKSNSHPVMSFLMRENGTITDISFEGENDVNKNGYDYLIENDGKHPAKIYSTSYLSIKKKQVGTVSQEDLHKFEEYLKSQIK